MAQGPPLARLATSGTRPKTHPSPSGSLGAAKASRWKPASRGGRAMRLYSGCNAGSTELDACSARGC